MRPWAHYVGAVAGQAFYELLFLNVGPLFVLGLFFVIGEVPYLPELLQ
jgi:hypothetical protein